MWKQRFSALLLVAATSTLLRVAFEPTVNHLVDRGLGFQVSLSNTSTVPFSPSRRTH